MQGYIRSLDGLRAFAVLLVITVHWPFAFYRFNFGWIGVTIFFALSGFLITRILLDSRDRNRAPGGGGLKHYLYIFFTRRTLRIFPLYYAFLLAVGGGLLAAVFLRGGEQNLSEALRTTYRAWQQAWPLLFSYTYNFLHAKNYVAAAHHEAPTPIVLMFVHMWSLAVEEQFYLVFPFVVWLLPNKALRATLWATVLLMPLARLGVGEWLRPAPGTDPATAERMLDELGHVLARCPPFCFDTLALGGLLAMGVGRSIQHPGRWLLIGLVAMLGLNALYLSALQNAGVAVTWHKFFDVNNPIGQYSNGWLAPWWLRVQYAFNPLLLIGLSALLLRWVVDASPLVRRIFEGNVVVQIGRISYGIYVLHYPLLAIGITARVRAWVESHGVPGETAALVIYLIVVYVLATVSFRYFETFFLRLKERVSAQKAAAQPVVSAKV